ncbi:zinc finger, C6HC-type containing protein [Tanacetum coccineum]
MAGSSVFDPYSIDDDDSYFPPLIDQEPNLFISDGSYAEQLQLQEALVFSSAEQLQLQEALVFSSASRASTLSSVKTPIVTFESNQVPDRFCDICMDPKTESEMFRNTKVCRHMFCLECIRGHVSAKVTENISKVRCPDPNCKGVIGPEVCRSIVPREVLHRWEKALCESLIIGAEKFYCPFKDCSALLVDDVGETVTSSECPHCNRLFCAQCKVTWHSGMSCSKYQSLGKDERDPCDIMLMNLAKNEKWKRCPNCHFYVEKNTGCEHISCRLGS